MDPRNIAWQDQRTIKRRPGLSHLRCTTVALALLVGSGAPVVSVSAQRSIDIPGTVFIRTVGGPVVRGAGAEVYLLPGSSSTLIERAGWCTAEYADIEAMVGRREAGLSPIRSLDARASHIRTTDSLVARRIRVARREVLSRGAIQSATGDVDGAFKFSSVPSGRYVVTAEMSWAGQWAAWWSSVTVTRDGTLIMGKALVERLDLSHVNALPNDFEPCALGSTGVP